MKNVNDVLKAMHEQEEGQGIYIGGGALFIIVVIILLLLLL